MFDQQARLERLLSRHRDAVVVEPLPGRPALVRRDQLLVAASDMPAVERFARRWYDSCHDEPGVCRLRLRSRARVDVCELAAELSGSALRGSELGGGSGRRHRRLAVTPNHLVHGQPLWWSGPADLPRPTPPIDLPGAAPSTPGARPVTVAVLDTGLSPHPWYDTREWYAEQRAEVAETLDADLDYELDAQAGHGTFVAGVILQRAPFARIRAKKVIGGDGIGDELDVVRALNWLAEWGQADIVNLSLGCHTYDDRPSPVLAQAIATLGRRTVVVACAGNAASDRPFWPAALKSVIAVAALDGDDRAWFSNYGWWVDACAPGVDITSSFVHFDGPLEGSWQEVSGIDPDAFRGYATWSGTSFAAPAVAGAIADLAASANLPAAVAADRLIEPTDAPSHPDLGVIIRV